jgi:tetratricopeptide (TPR) repeat protein
MYRAPEIPDEIEAADLDPEVRSELISLARDVADQVSRHLVAAGQVIDEDSELALKHAIAARRLASRIAVVREAVGLAAYAAGDWTTAIAELRTYHRMTGRQTHLAELADCERALGRPERAIDLYRGADLESLDKAGAIELLIVAAGARGDLGQHDAAVAMLQVRELTADEDAEWAARLRYAYADALLAAGRREEAREWFSRAATVDDDQLTDAAERLLEMDGVTIEGDEDEDEDEEDDEAGAEHDRAVEDEAGDDRDGYGRGEDGDDFLDENGDEDENGDGDEDGDDVTDTDLNTDALDRGDDVDLEDEDEHAHDDEDDENDDDFDEVEDDGDGAGEEEVEQDDDLAEDPDGGVSTDQHGEFDDLPSGGGVGTDQHGEFDDLPSGGGVGTDQHGEFDDLPSGGGVSTDQHGQFDDGVVKAAKFLEPAEAPEGGVGTDQHGEFDDGVTGVARVEEDAKAADDTFVGEAEPKRPQE